MCACVRACGCVREREREILNVGENGKVIFTCILLKKIVTNSDKD